MPITDIAALLLGLGIAVAVAAVAAGITKKTDESMRWEGGVALGFSALIMLGPFWIAQAVCTVISTIDDGGLSPWWLWAWLFAAPAFGASPPMVALIGRLNRLRPRSSERLNPLPRVQFLADQAWADTAAEPGWELRRTPPLPELWPPTAGGPVSWFCYAERDDTPAAIEVSAPFARIELAVGAPDPVVHRITDRVESLGPQGIHPLSPDALRASGPTHLSLVEAIRRGDPAGVLATALQQWRALNGLVAAHPSVAVRLPPLHSQ